MILRASCLMGLERYIPVDGIASGKAAASTSIDRVGICEVMEMKERFSSMASPRRLQGRGRCEAGRQGDGDYEGDQNICVKLHE